MWTSRKSLIQWIVKAFGLLHFYGIPDKLLLLIVVIQKSRNAVLNLFDGNTRYFKMMTCVKQGGVLSFFSFVLVGDSIFRQLNGHGTWIADRLQKDVNFAGDFEFIEADKQKL